MKAYFLFFSCVLACSVAQASPRISRASYAQMKQDVQDYSEVLRNIDGCDFRIEEFASNSMRLTMMDPIKGSVTLEVNAHSVIALESGDEVEDGSFSRSYKIAGAGELDIVHAADAFEHAFLTGADGRTLSCEVDF